MNYYNYNIKLYIYNMIITYYNIYIYNLEPRELLYFVRMFLGS